MSNFIVARALEAEIHSAKTIEDAQRTSVRILEATAAYKTTAAELDEVEQHLLAIVILSAAHRSEHSYSLKYMRQLLKHDLHAWRSALPTDMNQFYKAFLERTAPSFRSVAQSGLLARLSTIH
ncbi:MAG TPA: hypothetical protein V6C86_06705 [Oculatellaceae cyanobacterium]